MSALRNCIRAAAVILAIGLMSACGGGGSDAPPPVGPAPTPAQTVIDVNAAVGAELLDSVNGHRFVFPDGGSGQLRITRLSASELPAAAPAAAGQGWRIEFSGTQPVELVLNGAFDGTASWPMVFDWARLTQASISDGMGAGPRWVVVPARLLSPGRYAFRLSSAPALAVGTAQRLQAATETGVAGGTFIVELPKSEVDRMLEMERRRAAAMAKIEAALPATLAATFSTRRQLAGLTLGVGTGEYYTGFVHVRPLYSFRPVISVKPDLQALEHELGHYVTHLLVGDEAYHFLEKQGHSGYAANHGILDLVGRGTINEDYAFFIEHFFTGKGGGYDLFKPGDFLRGRKAGADVPSHEGFTAAMLAATVRPTSSISNIDDARGAMLDVPVVGLTHGQVFEIIADGATDVDTLRRVIEEALDADGRRRFQVNAQRLGWRYAATLRVLDDAGVPVAGAAARLLVNAGGRDYVSDIGTTAADGMFSLSFAYPGKATLQVVRGGTVQGTSIVGGDEALEREIAIDWDRPTNEIIALGDVILPPLRRQVEAFSVQYQSRLPVRQLPSGSQLSGTAVSSGGIQMNGNASTFGQMILRTSDWSSADLTITVSPLHPVTLEATITPAAGEDWFSTRSWIWRHIDPTRTERIEGQITSCRFVLISGYGYPDEKVEQEFGDGRVISLSLNYDPKTDVFRKNYLLTHHCDFTETHYREDGSSATQTGSLFHDNQAHISFVKGH